jgi:hypothetical protein
MCRAIPFGIGLLLTFAPGADPASAQTRNRFAIGANITSRMASDESSIGNTHIGLQWRIGHSDTGWGWKYGLNWFTTRLDKPIGGRTVELGELHVRPIMGGYGYTHTIRHTAIAMNLLGGYAFGGFRLDDGAKALYRAYYGPQRDVETHAGNTFVLKPEVSVWRDLSKKVGLHASVGYMFARPDVTVESAAGIERHHVRADVLQLTIGAVYSIF